MRCTLKAFCAAMSLVRRMNTMIKQGAALPSNTSSCYVNATKSTVNFDKSLLSPFLGGCVDKETTLGIPGGFPEYDEQQKLVHDATGAPPHAFQLDRIVCVQDPFELNRNVAKTVSIGNLFYFRQCLVLAAQACRDQELTSQPEKLYDYLLFGLPDKLVADKIVADKRSD
ncbi:mkg-r [Drosophila simulans]|uniref:Mkg-r n=1 Tax=Drosophila simulans TaxID=7240 RepID=B4NTS0_DROSI|nr:mkg-r [Drosophila simulans]